MFPLYDGTHFVEQNQDVIAISANYRLNTFGFLGSDALRGDDNSTGNWGIQDQREVMRWVHANAAALGADSSRVMIFGESAGAGSVANHLVNPRSWAYFSRAGMESGPISPWSSQTLKAATERFDVLAKRLGCLSPSDLASCLRSRNTSEVSAASKHLPATAAIDLLEWSPVVDGVELSASPEVLAARGQLAPSVSALLGTNRDESTTLVKFDLNATYDDFKAYIEKRLPGKGTAVVSQYPTSSYPRTPFASSAWWALMAAIGDWLMACPARRTARWLAAGATPSPAYLYFFKHLVSLVPAVELAEKKPLGVFHGSELAFVFSFPGALLTSEELRLRESIRRYWVSFAKDARPTSINQTDWEPHAARGAALLLDTPQPSLSLDLKSSACDFWDALSST